MERTWLKRRARSIASPRRNRQVDSGQRAFLDTKKRAKSSYASSVAKSLPELDSSGTIECHAGRACGFRPELDDGAVWKNEDCDAVGKKCISAEYVVFSHPFEEMSNSVDSRTNNNKTSRKMRVPFPKALPRARGDDRTPSSSEGVERVVSCPRQMKRTVVSTPRVRLRPHVPAHRRARFRTIQSHQSSERFADPPPPLTSGDSSLPTRRGPSLASGTALETTRRLAAVPGDGDVASGDPPEVSQSPREKGTSRVARGRGRRRGRSWPAGFGEETPSFRETEEKQETVDDEEESARSRERGAGSAGDERGPTARLSAGARRRGARNSAGDDRSRLRRRRDRRRADLRGGEGKRREGGEGDARAAEPIWFTAERDANARRRTRGSAGVGRSPVQSARERRRGATRSDERRRRDAFRLRRMRSVTRARVRDGTRRRHRVGRCADERDARNERDERDVRAFF